ncbi:MAG TPA: hypothetical protein VHW09_18235 [Bryobacteraceae bacterium]|jgi:hypothetical protein|nr:hypothetical protein [Bryobacteraceae bacterium]
MILTIDLPDEKTAPLTAIAQAQGLTAEQYARQLVENAIAAAMPQADASPPRISRNCSRHCAA